MNIAIGIIVLIIIWLVWSRYSTNKQIKEAFESVEQGKPFLLNLGLREVIGYCKKNNMEFTPMMTTGTGFLIVEYNDKAITVQQRGSYRLGESFFFIQ